MTKGETQRKKKNKKPTTPNEEYNKKKSNYSIHHLSLLCSTKETGGGKAGYSWVS